MSLPTFSPGDELGHYRLSEKIGSGGQGEVWRARDERFDRDVAVKILPPNVLNNESARERFRREARAVGRLNHPNVATAHDFDDKPVDYLVTEYVAGTGLDQKLAGGALPEDIVITLGIQLASGLEAAHRQGIIHRDLKPGNLRINEEGNLKILDFGLAEIVDPSTDIASLETVTLNMTLTGTLPYMAPEQFGGLSDPRTDLWSTGAVLYEMATGKLPFQETQLQQLRDAIINKEPTRPAEINPAISPGLERVILHCLQKDPNKRYQSATALREDLARVAQGRRVRVDDGMRGRSFAAALLALVLAVSGFAGYHFWPVIRERLWGQQANTSAEFHILAVLPIETGGQDDADNALVRGVAETVSARIAQGTNGQNFQLIPPNELVAQGVKTAEQARREFNVDRVLSIALQRSGEKMRVTCSLIDPRTHRILDARTLTGEANELFALEDNAVAEVFVMLPPDARLEQPAPTEVQAAGPVGYESYLKGRGFLLDYQKPENIDSAIAAFQQALKVSPNYAPAYAGLGEAYWRAYEAHRGKNWLDLATVNCEKALGTDPKLAEGHVCLGNLYMDTGRYDMAVDAFNRALATDKTNILAFSGLGEAYDRLGKPAEAEETYKKAIAARAQYWAVYNWLGAFYEGESRYADAVPMFKKVIELTPDNQRGYYNLGGALLMMGKYDEAIESLNRSIKLRPTLSAYSNLGAAYFWQHRYSEAIPAFEKARDLDNKDYLNWGNLGDALYWSPSRRSEAMAAYKRAIALAQSQLQVNPNDATARAYVAEYSSMIGDKGEATAEIQKALELAPQDADVMFRAGLVYHQIGDRQRTLDYLTKALNAKYSRSVIRDTPDFSQLRSDPAFAPLIGDH